MIWVTVILGALSLLLQWLQNRKRGNESLSEDNKRKLNNLVFRFREVEGAAVSLGCKPGGEPSAESAEDPQKLLDGLLSLGNEIDPQAPGNLASKATRALPQTREQARAAILSDIDRLLQHTFLLTRDQQTMLRAQQSFWSGDDGTQLDKVLALLK